VDADGDARRARLKRTAKSCGPGAPTLALRSRVYPANDGGKRARSPGRSRISRKTIAQGRPDDPPVPVVLPRAFCCTRTAGAVGTRLSLRPLFFRGPNDQSNTRANLRRDREAVAAHGVAVSKSNLSHTAAVIVREGGRSSIPEASARESRGHGVLDTRMRGYDGSCLSQAPMRGEIAEVYLKPEGRGYEAQASCARKVGRCEPADAIRP
jgi:hypothetical protein